MIRRIAAAVLAVLVAATPAAAASPELTRIIGLRWSGVSEQPADFTQNGKAYLKQTLSLSVDGDDAVSGRATTRFTLDGVSYDATYRVSGRFDGRDGITLTSSLVSGDQLPHGLRWCSGDSRLTLYRDQERAGHFILKGTSSDDCGGRSEMEYTDE